MERQTLSRVRFFHVAVLTKSVVAPYLHKRMTQNRMWPSANTKSSDATVLRSDAHAKLALADWLGYVDRCEVHIVLRSDLRD